MTAIAEHYLAAARVPETLQPCEEFPWEIERRDVTPEELPRTGWPRITLLRLTTLANIHRRPDVVMEDGRRELSKHLPIWIHARGRVLVTGLGLGCVVRGLLANPRVERVDVVELEEWILEVVGPEFEDDPRVSLIHADAHRWRPAEAYDYAWHDLHDNEGVGDHVQLQHARLLHRMKRHVRGAQGAWAFPRDMKPIARDAMGFIG